MSQESSASDRRQAILAAAQKVFDARGFAEATIDAVAHEAGIAKGSVYNYFASKQELFKQVFLATLADQEMAAARQVTELPLPAGQKIQRMLDEWFLRLAYYRKMGRLVLECWAAAAREEREGELARTLGQVYTRWRDLLAEVIRQGVREGEFHLQFEPSVAASLLVAVGNGIMYQTVMNVGSPVDETMIAALKKAILAGLKAGTILDQAAIKGTVR